MQLSLKHASYGQLPQQPWCEPYFLSSHMLYLSSQRTKLSDFSVLKFLEKDKDHCKKTMEQREQVVGEICKLMCHSPWKAPI
jgi:hypothetical protein